MAPLGIAVIGNKIIVSNAPDLIVYTDVDGDRVFDPAVDKREVLLTGFDGRNHDHALHSVTFGPDGRWYFSQGNAGANFTDRGGKTFRVGSAYNPVPDGGAQPVFGSSPPSYAGAKSDDGHVYVGGFSARMQPDGTGVEIIGFNFRNSYEQTVTSFGDIFHNDNDDPPACRTTYLMEYGNLGFFSRDGKRYWQADRRPGQSIPTAEWRQEDPGVIPAGDVYGGGAPTGIVFNEGDGLGKKWRGLLLSARKPRATRSLAISRRREGAGYQLDRFEFPDQQHRATVRGHGLQGRQGQLARSRRSSGPRMWRSGRMAPSTSPTGSIRAWAATTTRTTPPPGLSTASRPRASNPWCRRSISRHVDGADRRRCEVPRSTCVRAGFTALAARGAAAHRPPWKNCWAMRTRSSAHARCGCWRGWGPTGSARVEALLADKDPMTARRGLSRAAAGRAARCRHRVASWRAIRRRPCAAKWRCRCATCRSSRRARSAADAGERLRRQGSQLPRSLGHRRHRQGRGRCTRRWPPTQARNGCRRSGRRLIRISSGV